MRTEPGVIAAGAAEPVPFNGDHWANSFEIEGRPDIPGDPGPHGYHAFISPEYLQALQTPLLAGRYFTDADRLGAQPVTMIDENLARAYWPHESPIGGKIRNGHNSPWSVIVGIVRHIKAYDLASSDTRGIHYEPIYQSPMSYMNFVVRTTGDPHAMASVIERAVHKQDRSLSVFDVATLEERISKAIGPQQFATELLAAFAGAALLLAALGLYGVVSYSAGQRKKEIGIRSALGASKWQILSAIAAGGLKVVLIGLVFGAFLSAVLVRVLSPLIEKASLDGATVLVAALFLSIVTTIAIALPAWRATTINPLCEMSNHVSSGIYLAWGKNNVLQTVGHACRYGADADSYCAERLFFVNHGLRRQPFR